MTLKKYARFLGISNGVHRGFARVYVLASEIVAYTDNRIGAQTILELLTAYQRKKTLSMDEMWNIGVFIQIALIENIRGICEKIYFSQMQKYRVENILERIIENKEDIKFNNISEYKQRVKGYGEVKYPFIEYMSYRLKKYGKKAYSYLNILEEQVNKLGTSIDEVIKKEHFDVALKKVSMANSILSIKELLRMDFMKIFQNINEVEEILKKDPAKVYNKMDFKSKEYYRNAIKEISSKTKMSEIYIASKIIEICNKVEAVTNKETQNKIKDIASIETNTHSYIEHEKSESLNIKNEKQKHVGYYLIGDGREELINKLTDNNKKRVTNKQKVKKYIFTIWSITIIANLLITSIFFNNLNMNPVVSIISSIILFMVLLIPLQGIVVEIVQYILGKTKKPKLIPKLDLSIKRN